MISPSADELAAIAAAFLIVAPRDDADGTDLPHTPRWALAGRLAVENAPDARFAARSASRWAAAGRFDG